MDESSARFHPKRGRKSRGLRRIKAKRLQYNEFHPSSSEICLLTNARRVASVRAEVYSNLYSLDRESFLAVLDNYPLMRRTMESVAAERLSKIGQNPAIVSNREDLKEDLSLVKEIVSSVQSPGETDESSSEINNSDDAAGNGNRCSGDKGDYAGGGSLSSLWSSQPSGEGLSITGQMRQRLRLKRTSANNGRKRFWRAAPQKHLRRDSLEVEAAGLIMEQETLEIEKERVTDRTDGIDRGLLRGGNLSIPHKLASRPKRSIQCRNGLGGVAKLLRKAASRQGHSDEESLSNLEQQKNDSIEPNNKISQIRLQPLSMVMRKHSFKFLASKREVEQEEKRKNNLLEIQLPTVEMSGEAETFTRAKQKEGDSLALLVSEKQSWLAKKTQDNKSILTGDKEKNEGIKENKEKGRQSILITNKGEKLTDISDDDRKKGLFLEKEIRDLDIANRRIKERMDEAKSKKHYLEVVQDKRKISRNSLQINRRSYKENTNCSSQKDLNLLKVFSVKTSAQSRSNESLY